MTASRFKSFLTQGLARPCGIPKWQRLLGVILAGGCSWCHNSTSPGAVQEERVLVHQLLCADDLQGLLRTQVQTDTTKCSRIHLHLCD